MAVDKLVDSTQLDADLTSVANAIRTKGGTSASLAFPSGFVSAVNAISTGGTDYLEGYLRNNLASYENTNVTRLYGYALASATSLTSVKLPNVTQIDGYAFYNCGATALSFQKLSSSGLGSYAFQNSKAIKLDLKGMTTIKVSTFSKSYSFNVLVLRRADAIVTLAGTNAFSDTPFASGKAGGTLYVPNSLIATYQSASNWSTILGYTNNSIKSIESTHTDPNAPFDMTLYYADGTAIST